jgi:hypothetical protein
VNSRFGGTNFAFFAKPTALAVGLRKGRNIPLKMRITGFSNPDSHNSQFSILNSKLLIANCSDKLRDK